MSDVEAVAFELNSVAIHLVRRLRKTDAALGVSAARLSALSVLVFGGPRTLSQLAEAEQVTAPTMTRLVAALERDDLVERQPNTDDARSWVITPTRKGRGLMERGRRARVQQLAAELRSLPKGDLATVARAAAILRRLE